MQLRAFVVMVGVGSVLGGSVAACGEASGGYGTARQALVTEPTWSPLNLVGVAPPARFDHAMAYDSDRRVVVLFGGTATTSGGSEFQDTWEWSMGSSSWREVGPGTCQTATCPSVRHGHTMVYDPGLGATVLFGGHASTGWYNDLWIWKDGRWTAVDQSGQTIPDVRHNHSMVYDPVGQGSPVIWMLGGSVNNNTQSDLWALSVDASGTVPTANWTSLGDAPLPDRYGHAMTYAAGLDAIYVFGGRSFMSGVHNDLWKMDRSLVWTDVSPQAPPLNIAPADRYQVPMASYADVLVVFGGTQTNLVDFHADTWEGGESGWEEIAPAGSLPMARGEHALVATPAGLFLYGGRGRPSGSSAPLDDTYLYERPGPPPVDGGSPDGGGDPDGGGPDGGGEADGGTEDGGTLPGDPVPRYQCSSSSGGGGLILLSLGLIALLALARPGRRLFGLLLVAALCLPSLATAREEDELGRPKMKLAFLGLSAGTGGQADLAPDAKALSEFVQSELGSLDIYDVMGPEEVRGLLGLEEQRQLLGCTASGSCADTMAPALDAERILAGNLGRVGSRFVLNLTLVNQTTQRNISRTARHSRNLDDLLDDVRPALLELISRDLEIADSFDRDRIPESISPLWETPAEGLLLAPRLDLEVLAQTRLDSTFGVGLGVGLQLGWRMGRAGVATTLLLKPLGVRLAGRFHPVSLWRFLPYLEGGMAIFFDSLSTRVGLGFELDLRPFRLFVDLAYEYGITSWATASGSEVKTYLKDSLLIGGGVGWSF